MNDELIETLGDLSDYYTDITGASITLGVDSGGDVYLSSNRTHGKEYFDSIEEAERRVKILYSDVIEDEDEDDFLEDF